MRILKLSIAAVAVTGAVPALAVGLGDLAKVVLGNGAVLQKGKDNCPDALGLGDNDMVALSIARQAAQSALPAAQFIKLDTAASSQAVVKARAPTFCTQTAKRKNVLLDAVKKAGQKLVTAKVLGL